MCSSRVAVPCPTPSICGVTFHYQGTESYKQCLDRLSKRAEISLANEIALPPVASLDYPDLYDVPTADDSTTVFASSIRPGDQIDLAPILFRYDDDYEYGSTVFDFEKASVTAVNQEGGAVVLGIEGYGAVEVPEDSEVERYDFLYAVPREDDKEFLAKELNAYEAGMAGISSDWEELDPPVQWAYLADAYDIVEVLGDKRDFTEEELDELSIALVRGESTELGIDDLDPNEVGEGRNAIEYSIRALGGTITL